MKKVEHGPFVDFSMMILHMFLSLTSLATFASGAMESVMRPFSVCDDDDRVVRATCRR